MFESSRGSPSPSSYRKFNGSIYDAEMVMSKFAGSLRDGSDMDGVIVGWLDVVGQTMEPRAIGVWVRE